MADGELKRLLIYGYDDPKMPEPAVASFQAFANPAEVTLGYEAEYHQETAAGAANGPLRFKRIKPSDLTVALFIDGTGADGRRVGVREEIDKFRLVTGYHGKIHEPRYLKIAWGTLPILRCKLKSASIAYKLFKPDGTALRAVVTAVFTESIDPETGTALKQDESADLTHVRLVKAGDTLPALCEEIYREPRMYIEVARANGLDNFRALQPGMRLRFPPLEK